MRSTTLGSCTPTGRVYLKDDAEAVKWYRLAAEQGLANAQHNLGVMYDNGRGVPQDDAEAVKWYRLAAEQGFANAQYNLGAMYADGIGVLKDDAEAVKLVPSGCRSGPSQCAVQPRGHLRQRAGRSQGFRARAHVVQHRWRKRE